MVDIVHTEMYLRTIYANETHVLIRLHKNTFSQHEQCFMFVYGCFLFTSSHLDLKWPNTQHSGQIGQNIQN